MVRAALTGNTDQTERENDIVLAKMVLLAVALMLAACSSTSPTFTPEQRQYGMGCHQGQNLDTYCY